MTHSDPARDPRTGARPGPKRSARFNGLVVLLVVLLLAIAGAYVWSHWSLDDDSARDNSADNPVQPAYVPPPDAGSPSPEGAEAPR